jgi:hypothetical protein
VAGDAFRTHDDRLVVYWFFVPEVVFAWEVTGEGGGGGVTEAAVEMGGYV